MNVSRVANSTVKAAKKPLMEKFLDSKPVEKFLTSKTLHKALDVVSNDPVKFNALVAMGICLVPRPITNYITTKDKKDAAYASGHSISSGLIGYAWPIVFVTPIARALTGISKNPAKYLNGETVRKFYPQVKLEEIVGKNGKTKIKAAMNQNDELLDKAGEVICQSNEPLNIFNDATKAAFNKRYSNVAYVDGDVVRSKLSPKTKAGVICKDKNGETIGNAIQEKNFRVEDDGRVTKPIYKTDKDGKYVTEKDDKGKDVRIEIGREEVTEKDFTPITEEMEIAKAKEDSLHKIIKFVPDILLAPARASLTIAMIPPMLNMLGIRKSDKSKNNGQPAPRVPLNVVSQSDNTVVNGTSPMQVSAPVKKGAA